MLKHILSVLAFIVISFTVQGLNHFIVNKAHYSDITFAREQPVFALGLLAMIIQGTILTFAMSLFDIYYKGIKKGMTVSLTFGLFLAVYIALAEPAKYAAPSIPSWIAIESVASTIQFVTFGIALGIIHLKYDGSKAD